MRYDTDDLYDDEDRWKSDERFVSVIRYVIGLGLVFMVMGLGATVLKLMFSLVLP